MLTDRSLRRASVKFKHPVDCQELENLPNVKLLSFHDGRRAELQVWGEMDGLIKALGSYPILDLETDRPSLEEAFLEYYRDEQKQTEVT